MWTTLAVSLAAPVVLFLLILWVLRRVFLRLSGWGRLQRRYGALPPEGGWETRGESATVGPIRFRRIVRVAVSGDGLCLAVGGLVPLPSIRIPWQEFTAARLTRFYSQSVVELTLAQPLPPIQVGMALYNRIAVHLKVPLDGLS